MAVLKADVGKLVSLTELKTNLGMYVDKAQDMDILITKNGKVVARLTTAKPDKVAAAKALFGILPNDVNLDDEREARLV